MGQGIHRSSSWRPLSHPLRPTTWMQYANFLEKPQNPEKLWPHRSWLPAAVMWAKAFILFPQVKDALLTI